MKQLAIGVRIYNDPINPNYIKADIKMSDGVVETIDWIDHRMRNMFEITGYTYIYDERRKPDWSVLH